MEGKPLRGKIGFNMGEEKVCRVENRLGCDLAKEATQKTTIIQIPFSVLLRYTYREVQHAREWTEGLNKK